jgi:hypothetical protein
MLQLQVNAESAEIYDPSTFANASNGYPFS